MGVKISELPEATSVQEEDIMPIVQNGETKKVSMSKVGGNEVFIGDTEEAPDTAKIIIDDEGQPMFSSEVVNSLSGNETAKAPSVRAVKDELEWKKTTGTTIPECNEAIIYVSWGNGQYNLDFSVNYSYLQTGEKNFFNGGYRSSSAYLYCWLKILNNVVSINRLIDENGDITNPSIDIYYR